MMLFLIEYNRLRGQIVKFEVFDDAQRKQAEESRLEIELNPNRRKIDDEVVLLQAASEEALRRTHRRYFEDLAELVETG